MHRTLRAAALAFTTLAACSYVPARFADRPAAEAAGDEAPIPMPRVQRGFSADTITNLHLRHVLVDALDPRRTPEAGDINALDEVPASSWFRPAAPGEALGDDAAPPAPPLRVTTLDAGWPRPASTARAAIEGAVLAVTDARGRRYVLRRDPGGSVPASAPAPVPVPASTTAAEAIASRLVRAIGYLTPRVDLLELAPGDLIGPADVVRGFLGAGPPPRAGRYRVGAIRWPIGTDLGPTFASGTRRDDANDRVPHSDRRTLRALGMVAGWLRIVRLDPEHLRDVYVGAPGRGHVEHLLVGLHGALGVDPRGDARANDGPLLRLLTLGLAPEHSAARTQTRWPMLGEIGPVVTRSEISPSPPFAPLDRALPGDAYWAAKRIAAIPQSTLVRAVDAGRLGDAGAAAWLVRVLEARRSQIVTYAFGRVTPCEVEGISGSSLILLDLGIAHGIWPAGATRYEIELLSGSGDPIAPPRTIAPTSARVRVPLPDSAAAGAYLVVRVRAERASGPPAQDPAPMEVHLHPRPGGADHLGGASAGAGWQVRGVRH